MHRYDDVELADHLKSAERTDESRLDRPTQQALAQHEAGALGVQRMAALQRAAGNAGVAGLVEEGAGDSVRSVLSSGSGRPLDRETRSEMEPRLGADLSSVRVHTGGEASRSTKAVAATAYTVGDDVVFGDGHYDPTSHAGKRTLAHELTHVVQQRRGPVDGTSAGDGIKVSDPSDRFEREAEANADAMMSMQTAQPTPATSGTIQREVSAEEEEEEEEELQMQREGEAEEEEELQMQREGEAEEEEEELQM